MMKAEDIKRHEREVYDSVAEVFDKVLTRYNARFAADLIDLMFPQKREAALDIAGGTGAAGLRLAERVTDEGSVTIIDLSPSMLHQAEKNAAGRRLTNVTALVMDAEQLDFPDATFDLITCSFGIMFFPNVRRALAEAKRVLKPGGRLGCTVWSVPDRFPLFAVPMTAVVARMAPAPIRLLLRAPGIKNIARRKMLISRGPSGFSPARFSARGTLEKHMRQAGFESVRRELRAYPIEFDSFDDYWDALTRGTGAKDMAERLPAEIIAEVKQEARNRLVNPATGGVLMYNEAALVLARKPV